MEIPGNTEILDLYRILSLSSTSVFYQSVWVPEGISTTFLFTNFKYSVLKLR